jgi:hypothetical protein
MTNNFNTSSTGINVKVSIEFDANMAQISWEENFKHVNDGKFAYIDFGNLSGDMPEIQPLPRQKGKIIDAICGKDDFWLTKAEMQKEYTQEEIVDEISDYFWNKEEVLEFFEEHDIKTNVDDMAEISITGYAQGDRATILVNTKEFKKVSGAEFNEDDYTEYFTDLFYSQPLYARATVNDEEYYSEKFDGQYVEFDKEEYISELIANILTDNTEIDESVLQDELEKIVPDYPEYNNY